MGLEFAGGEGFVVFGWVVEHGTDINFGRTAFHDCGRELFLGEETLVADVNFVSRGRFDGHAEFTAGKRRRRGRGILADIVGRRAGVGGGWIVGEPRV